MKILLLGGSNAGMREGWAFQFQRQASAHEVENRFLGAVGSLYGLLALLKMERDATASPDVVIFEYCLNDILLFAAGCLRPSLVADTLEAIAACCARRRIRLMFLCLDPRPMASKSLRSATRRAHRLYADAATRYATPAIWLDEIFSGSLTAAHYQDENHLTVDASTAVAAAVLNRIGDARIPLAPNAEIRFDYVDAAQAQRRGACELHHIDSKVFEGAFIHLNRQSECYWPGSGRLVALMLRSDDRSGEYLIRAPRCVYRKNPRSKMQEIVANLMLLHYVTRAIATDRGVAIAMPDDEAALKRAPEDATLLAVPPTADFLDQTLDIHAAIFWRPRSIARKIVALLRRR
ncbi:hypothetical protein [Methylocystis sp.]|uniref:hypothetical protein n=1 Tax=Methylocystis sp. TaxID=1911079 RepID=UPI0027326E7E|nr:hypothetical protein [Methylocystis sp.]MDP3554915.1 hypothetical protein [Methylocystis sp.]